MLPELDAALVDLDGTLVDTVGDFEVALRLALADIGRPPVDRAFIARTVGKGSEYLLRQSLAHIGGAPDQYEALWARYQAHYADINGQYADLFPGAREGLQKLRAAGLRLVCITNKPGRFAQALLASKGVVGHFEHVFGGDAFARNKPDPMPLIEGCKALGTAPARTLMVGDSVNDALAARAAGCPLALARYGYNHGEPIDSVPANVYFDRLDELVVKGAK